MTQCHKTIVKAVNKDGFKEGGLNSWKAGLPMTITLKAAAIPKRRLSGEEHVLISCCELPESSGTRNKMLD